MSPSNSASRILASALISCSLIFMPTHAQATPTANAFVTAPSKINVPGTKRFLIASCFGSYSKRKELDFSIAASTYLGTLEKDTEKLYGYLDVVFEKLAYGKVASVEKSALKVAQKYLDRANDLVRESTSTLPDLREEMKMLEEVIMELDT